MECSEEEAYRYHAKSRGFKFFVKPAVNRYLIRARVVQRKQRE